MSQRQLTLRGREATGVSQLVQHLDALTAHGKPLFPESLLHVSRRAGLTSAHVAFSRARGDVELDRRHVGEYAVIAHA